MLVAWSVVFTLFLANDFYQWLIRKEVITGPELRTSFVLLGLIMASNLSSYERLKHRWVKGTFYFFAMAAAALLAIGFVDMIRPFPESTHLFLDFEILSAAFTIIICIFYMIVFVVYPPPSEKKRLTRKEKIKVAIVIISVIAGTAFWFGGRELLYWLLTR